MKKFFKLPSKVVKYFTPLDRAEIIDEIIKSRVNDLIYNPVKGVNLRNDEIAYIALQTNKLTKEVVLERLQKMQHEIDLAHLTLKKI